MKVMKRFGFLAVLLAAALFVQSADAVPAGLKLLEESSSTTFTTALGPAVVDCEVHQYTDGVYLDKYLYTYQISNDIGSSISFSFFSVGVLEGAVIVDVGYDPIGGAVDPAVWDTSGMPVQSADAMFFDTIDAGEISALLWFVSDNAPVPEGCGGTLFGMSSGAPHYATGNLPAPVPEPGTVLILGIFGLVTLTRRRRYT